jgi:GH24 family phage-related lysozyme (muramidase)
MFMSPALPRRRLRRPSLLFGTALAVSALALAVNAPAAVAIDRPTTPPTNGPCPVNRAPRDMQAGEIKTLIAGHESSHGLAGDPTVYLDSASPPHPTVGIGFNLDRADARARLTAVGANYDDVRAGLVSLTQTQITQLFEADVASSIEQVRLLVPGFDALTMARQAVLVDMIFNLGPGGLATFKTMLAAVKSGDYDAAAASMTASLWARQVGTRATKDIALMKLGLICDLPPIPVMPPPISSDIPGIPTTNNGGTSYPGGVTTYQPEWTGGGNGPQRCRIERIEVFYYGDWVGVVNVYC